MKNSKSLAPIEIKDISKSGEFSGYGSVFGVLDSYRDIVVKGAFEKSLASYQSRGKFPKLLWQHDPDQPIGVYTEMREDDNGLYVEGKLLIDDDPVARKAYAHLKAGSVDGLSIGFRTIVDEFDSGENIRTLKEVDLWEVSVVTFPANDAALVSQVKQLSDLKDIIVDHKSFEKYLRDLGVSRAEATTVASAYKSVCNQSDSEERGAKQALELIEQIKKTIV